MSDFTRDDILLRACKVLIRNFANQVEEKRQVVHTRIFSYFLHPEERYVYYGASVSVTDESNNHPEHAVPCAVLINECFRLIKERDLAHDEIARLLKKHWKIVKVTKEESKKMDFELGYKSKMPQDWSFEDGDTFERFKLAKIDLLPESSSL